ncbi:hypothetical protein CRUP_020649 [Coryphaenoides rupestris]|nr:hypothetical protein CRUP_020649 [Coryphaenoides rupestris]
MKRTSGRGGARAWPGFTISKPRKLKVRTSLAVGGGDVRVGRLWKRRMPGRPFPAGSSVTVSFLS